jgi:hypothetical protein
MSLNDLRLCLSAGGSEFRKLVRARTNASISGLDKQSRLSTYFGFFRFRPAKVRLWQALVLGFA